MSTVGWLYISAVKGVDLKIKGITSHPAIRFQLDYIKKTTKPDKKNKVNPTFTEVFEFELLEHHQSIRIELLGKSMNDEHVFGRSDIDLREIKNRKKAELWVPIKHPTKAKENGKVLIKMEYITDREKKISEGDLSEAVPRPQPQVFQRPSSNQFQRPPPNFQRPSPGPRGPPFARPPQNYPNPGDFHPSGNPQYDYRPNSNQYYPPQQYDGYYGPPPQHQYYYPPPTQPMDEYGMYGHPLRPEQRPSQPEFDLPRPEYTPPFRGYPGNGPPQPYGVPPQNYQHLEPRIAPRPAPPPKTGPPNFASSGGKKYYQPPETARPNPYRPRPQ
eukprot:NODE_10_length_61504_cov_0.956502.p24 type:complete len:329 gc:universal NODE_10_length_61504_cov_0.956502:35499-36485(+)